MRTSSFKMKVVFRADSSSKIGGGHISRCLTLAQVLPKGSRVIFACIECLPNLRENILDSGFDFYLLPQQGNNTEIDQELDAKNTLDLIKNKIGPVDWIVVDHYDLGLNWEQVVAGIKLKVAVLDDLANRPHQAKLIIDPTFGRKENDYKSLVPESTTLLIGQEYALLRPEFWHERQRVLENKSRPTKDSLHVFFGSSDPSNYTLRFANLIALNWPQLFLRIVVDKSNPHINSLRDMALLYKRRIRIDQNVSNMARHMSDCSMGLGSPGTATWERACLFLPSAYIATAQNQIPILQSLKEAGLCAYLGQASKISDNEFLENFRHFIEDISAKDRMSRMGTAWDGLGANRIAESMLNFLN
jgi:UDP-2,4-diacetamido-2,4,6-trideoxy-beta-L-altropyranose hydrolase